MLPVIPAAQSHRHLPLLLTSSGRSPSCPWYPHLHVLGFLSLVMLGMCLVSANCASATNSIPTESDSEENGAIKVISSPASPPRCSRTALRTPVPQDQPYGHWHTTQQLPRLAWTDFGSMPLCNSPGMGNSCLSPAPPSTAARRAAAVISSRSNLAPRFFGEYTAEVSLISLTAVSPLRSLHNLWPKVIYLALFICPLKCLDGPSVAPVRGGQEFRHRFTKPQDPPAGKLHVCSPAAAQPPSLTT